MHDFFYYRDNFIAYWSNRSKSRSNSHSNPSGISYASRQYSHTKSTYCCIQVCQLKWQNSTIYDVIFSHSFSINEIQAKNKYFWHYQRYELVREYFQKPMFAYPPLSLLVYIWLVIKYCIGRKVCRVFSELFRRNNELRYILIIVTRASGYERIQSRMDSIWKWSNLSSRQRLCWGQI
jgi:hypothetical protein